MASRSSRCRGERRAARRHDRGQGARRRQDRADADKLLQAAYEDAKAIIVRERGVVEALRDALVAHDELIGGEIIAVVESVPASEAGARSRPQPSGPHRQGQLSFAIEVAAMAPPCVQRRHDGTVHSTPWGTRRWLSWAP